MKEEITIYDFNRKITLTVDPQKKCKQSTLTLKGTNVGNFLDTYWDAGWDEGNRAGFQTYGLEIDKLKAYFILNPSGKLIDVEGEDATGPFSIYVWENNSAATFSSSDFNHPLC